MEFLKSDIRAWSKKVLVLWILLSYLLIDCSEFNQSVKPTILFTQDAYNLFSHSTVGFSDNGKVMTLRTNWDIESDRFPMDVKIFIRERKENEYTADCLSELPIDIRIDMNITRSATSYKIVAFYSIIDSRGDTLASSITWSQEDQSVSVVFDEELQLNISLFFWQVEFYLEGDTLRLPEQPGIWYFDNDNMQDQ